MIAAANNHFLNAAILIQFIQDFKLVSFALDLPIFFSVLNS